MIDPKNVTNYNRSQEELEEFFLFTCVVAGKTANTQARLLENFIQSLPPGTSPFERIRTAYNSEILFDLIKASKLGQYNRLYKCFIAAIEFDLKIISLAQLEAIPGIGPKTSRFFLLHTRENQRIAALDVHILKHLRSFGFNAPISTPSNPKKYHELENAFLKLADQSGHTIADYDLKIWTDYSTGKAKTIGIP